MSQRQGPLSMAAAAGQPPSRCRCRSSWPALLLLRNACWCSSRWGCWAMRGPAAAAGALGAAAWGEGDMHHCCCCSCWQHEHYGLQQLQQQGSRPGTPGSLAAAAGSGEHSYQQQQQQQQQQLMGLGHCADSTGFGAFCVNGSGPSSNGVAAAVHRPGSPLPPDRCRAVLGGAHGGSSAGGSSEHLVHTQHCMRPRFTRLGQGWRLGSDGGEPMLAASAAGAGIIHESGAMTAAVAAQDGQCSAAVAADGAGAAGLGLDGRLSAAAAAVAGGEAAPQPVIVAASRQMTTSASPSAAVDNDGRRGSGAASLAGCASNKMPQIWRWQAPASA